MITAKKFEPEHDLQHPAGSGHMDCLGSSAATLMLFKGKKKWDLNVKPVI